MEGRGRRWLHVWRSQGGMRSIVRVGGPSIKATERGTGKSDRILTPVRREVRMTAQRGLPADGAHPAKPNGSRKNVKTTWVRNTENLWARSSISVDLKPPTNDTAATTSSESKASCTVRGSESAPLVSACQGNSSPNLTLSQETGVVLSSVGDQTSPADT